jgi:hypothetical protein
MKLIDYSSVIPSSSPADAIKDYKNAWFFRVTDYYGYNYNLKEMGRIIINNYTYIGGYGNNSYTGGFGDIERSDYFSYEPRPEINYNTSYIDATKFTRAQFETEEQKGLANFRIIAMGAPNLTPTGDKAILCFQVVPVFRQAHEYPILDLSQVSTSGSCIETPNITYTYYYKEIDTSKYYYSFDPEGVNPGSGLRLLKSIRVAGQFNSINMYPESDWCSLESEARLNQFKHTLYRVSVPVEPAAAYYVKTYILRIYDPNANLVAEHYYYIQPKEAHNAALVIPPTAIVPDPYLGRDPKLLLEKMYAPFGAFSSNVYTIPLYLDGTPQLISEVRDLSIQQIESGFIKSWQKYQIYDNPRYNSENPDFWKYVTAGGAQPNWGRLNSYYIHTFGLSNGTTTEGKTGNFSSMLRVPLAYIARAGYQYSGNSSGPFLVTDTRATYDYSPYRAEPSFSRLTGPWENGGLNYLPSTMYAKLTIKNLDGTPKRDSNNNPIQILLSDLKKFFEIDTGKYPPQPLLGNAERPAIDNDPFYNQQVPPVQYRQDAAAHHVPIFTPEMFEYFYLKYGECRIDYPVVTVSVYNIRFNSNTYYVFYDKNKPFPGINHNAEAFVPRLYIKTRKTNALRPSYRLPYTTAVLPTYLDYTYYFIDASELVFERATHVDAPTGTGYTGFNSITLTGYKYTPGQGVVQYGYLKWIDGNDKTQNLGSGPQVFTPPLTDKTFQQSIYGATFALYHSDSIAETEPAAYRSIPIRFGDTDPSVYRQFNYNTFNVAEMVVKYKDSRVTYPVINGAQPIPQAILNSFRKTEVWVPTLPPKSKLKELYIDNTGLYITDIVTDTGVTADYIRKNPTKYYDNTYFNSNFNFVKGYPLKVSAVLNLQEYKAETVTVNVADGAGGKK